VHLLVKEYYHYKNARYKDKNCPYVQLDVSEDSRKARFTVVMETTVDIIKWFEGGKKIIITSHTFDMNFSSVFNMFVHNRM